MPPARIELAHAVKKPLLVINRSASAGMRDPQLRRSAAALRAAGIGPAQDFDRTRHEIRRTLRDEAAIVNRGTPLAVRLESPAFTPMAQLRLSRP